MSTFRGLRSLFVPPLRMAGTAEPALASRAALDGRNFDGIVLECGKTSGDADTLIFKDGRFRSTACDHTAMATAPTRRRAPARRSCSKPKPRARSTASCSGKAWCAVPRLDGTMTMVRDGQAAGEKWVLAGEKR